MAMVTSGMIQIYRSVGRTEAVSTAQSQLSIAFLRLDREIRYAQAVATPGAADGDEQVAAGQDQYVEYLIPYAVDPDPSDSPGTIADARPGQRHRTTLHRRTSPGYPLRRTPSYSRA